MATRSRGCLLTSVLALIIGVGGVQLLAAGFALFSGARTPYIRDGEDAFIFMCFAAAQLVFGVFAWRWQTYGLNGLYVLSAISAGIAVFRGKSSEVQFFGVLIPLAWATVLWLASRPVLSAFETGDDGSDESRDEDDDDESGDDDESTEATRTCQSCSQANDHDATFCSHCGRRLANPRKCACGAVNAPEAHFCKKCGRKFEAATPPRRPGKKKRKPFTCTECGGLVNFGASECGGCGQLYRYEDGQPQPADG